MNNPAIIIGNDHPNTLGIIRSLGEAHIDVYLYIISNSKLIATTSSTYIKECHVCENENEAILRIIADFKDKRCQKPVLFPASDKAAEVIDRNLDYLNKKFLTPNIANRKNGIYEYMNKYNQYTLIVKHGIKAAKSAVLQAPFEEEIKLSFPIIIKPLFSTDGDKSDIVIIKTKEHLSKELSNFRQKQYDRILCQEVIDYDYECDISGYSINGTAEIPGYIIKERSWPEKTGSFTFGTVNSIENIQNIIKKIKNLIKDLDYTGIFDIDFFVKENELFLNEINFRNGALGYLYGDSNICVSYYQSIINGKNLGIKKVQKTYHAMDDLSDFHNVVSKKIKLKDYMKDRKKSKYLMRYNTNDKKPSRMMAAYKVLDELKLKMILDSFSKIINQKPKMYLLKQSGPIEKQAINSEYNIRSMLLGDIDKIEKNKKEREIIKKDYKNGVLRGVVLEDKKRIIGYAVSKSKNAYDKFITIDNKDSEVISHVFIDPNYRGNNLQAILIEQLMQERPNKKYYAVVYYYNIPSKKNLERLNFRTIGSFSIKRIAKHSVGKMKI